MDVRVYRNNDENVREYDEVLKFWSNGIGELCCPHGTVPYDISEEELPGELKRVYQDLYWEPNAGVSLRYMVETKNGYGIALINEYDSVTAENSGLLMRPLFETVIQDAKEVVKDPLFEKAEVFAGEFMGFDGCHELVVVFPADISVDTFCKAAARLDELTYQACGLGKLLDSKGLGTRGQGLGEELLNSDEFNNDFECRDGLSFEEKLAKAKDNSVRFVTESVVSVPGLGAQAQVRDRVLDVCYSIPGYEKLPLAEKNQLYDLVKKSVELSMEAEREMPF